MNIGILVHPFWSNIKNMETIYHNLKYDKVIVMLPMINKKLRDEFYLNHKEVIVDLIFRNYSTENAKLALTILETLNCKKFYTKILLRTLLYIRYNSLGKKLTIDELRDYLLKIDIEYIKRLSPILYFNSIYGDMVSFKRIKSSLKKLRKELIKQNIEVKLLPFGGTAFAQYCLEENKINNLFNCENRYEIFGEYYNKCVKDIRRDIKEKYKLNIIPNKKLSLYGAFEPNDRLKIRKQREFGLYISFENSNLKEL